MLQKLKAEHKIADFVTLNPEDQPVSLTNQVKDGDGVLLLLTHALMPHKEKIVSLLKALKIHHPEVKIAEIILDHVTYTNDFLTFPMDRKPIRGREDMDAAWTDIEQKLKKMFPPVSQEEAPVPGKDWKRYLKYAIPAVVIIALLLWWLIPPLGKGPDNGGTFTEKEAFPPVADFSSSETECEVPCEVTFTNASQNATGYRWDFGDGKSSSEAEPFHTYSEPGHYTVKLTAQRGDQQDNKTINIQIDHRFEVTNVTVGVSGSNSFSGACPHKFDFRGKITVNKTGTVRYTWLRSDGHTAPEQTLNFSEAGSQTVSTSWTLGEAGRTYNNMW